MSASLLDVEVGEPQADWTAIEADLDQLGVVAAFDAAEVIRDEMMQVVGIEGFGVPSSPGEPPRLQTGTGQEAINVVGASGHPEVVIEEQGAYLGYLDEGTEHVAARPWIAESLARAAARLEAEAA